MAQDTLPLDDNDSEDQRAAHLLLSDHYEDGATGALWVHKDMVLAREDWTTERHIAPIRVNETFGDVESVLEAVDDRMVDPRRVVIVDGVPHLLDIRFRMLRNPELARAMGFDDDEASYEFSGTQTDITKQIGNAVPVGLARALVTAILS